MPTIQSALGEVRDQLFLDRADNKYLSRVSSNLGLERPFMGFQNDDLWRAIVRRLALDYRQIANLFEDFLLHIFGPKNTVASVLTANTAATDEELTIESVVGFPQLGSFVIDEALASTETINYSFLDPRNGLATLGAALSNAHTAVTIPAEGYLLTSVVATGTSLPLVNSAEFPTSGFPYTLLVGQGTANEEVLQLTGHTPATNTLTVQPLTNGHSGATTTAITSLLTYQLVGSTSITVGDSSNFPEEGLIRIAEDGGTPSETVEYYSNDVDNNILYLKTPLTNTYTYPWTVGGGASVTLLETSVKVMLAQVQVKGVGWDVIETITKQIQLYIPEVLSSNRLQDASFIHNELISPTPNTTVGTASSVGDTSLIAVTNGLATFPSSGLIVVNSGGGTEETVHFTTREAQAYTQMYAVNGTTGIPIGTTVLFVEDVTPILAYDQINDTKTLILARNDVPNVETVNYTSIDAAANSITLVSATTIAHSAGDEVVPINGSTFYLSQPLANAHSAAETISLVQSVYSGTSLMDGRIFTSTNHLYQGSYLYGLSLERLIQNISTTLSENLSGPVEVAVDQLAGRYAIEVRHAELLDATGQFDVHIGRTKASSEIVDTKAVVLAQTFNATTETLNAAVSPGATVLTVTTTTNMPQPSAAPYGYRLAIGGQGGPGTLEIVSVHQVINATTFSTEVAITTSHGIGEYVRLLYDVIELSDPLSNLQKGAITYSDRYSLATAVTHRVLTERAYVEELRTHINVADASSFSPAGNHAIMNFGRNVLPAESRIATAVSAGATSIILESSDAFPTTGYSYFVAVGSRDPGWVELVQVTNNNTGTETLTLDATTPLKRAHSIAEWVRYFPGEQLIFEFHGRVTGTPERLTFDPYIRFDQDHLKNEPVHLSSVISLPNDTGTDFPFYISASWSDILKYIFDRGRAAGVEVILTSDR